MQITYIPEFLFETEDINTLKDKKLDFRKGTLTIGKYKVPCYEFLNLSTDDVFNKLEEDNLWEAQTTESDRRSFASRTMAIMFLRIREVANMKDKDARLAAVCGLIAANTALFPIDPSFARRILPLLRSV